MARLGEDGRSLGAEPTSETGSLAELLGGVAAAPAATPPIVPGQVLGGVYRIERRIGSGGMGVVFLARDLELQRDVAVKVHRASGGTERLQREAIAMAQLAHPNVLTVHGAGHVGDHVYVAMEYVPGADLEAWQAAAPRGWREVVTMMLGAGEGIAAAHDLGFVHRDVKPHNILVGRDGRPRVGDFGLVCVAGPGASVLPAMPEMRPSREDADVAPTDPGRPRSRRDQVGTAETIDSAHSPLASDLTKSGIAIGTPAYMAPEQHLGGAIDARADQFGFCVVLYEALYGRRPWLGASVAALAEAVTTRPPALPPPGRAPSWLWPIVRRGLAREPGERYPDMRALLAALRGAPRRRTRLVAAAIGAVVLAAGATVAVAAWPAPAARPPARTPVGDIVGTWSGTFGTLVIREVGDELWGAYGHDMGTIRGEMRGDVFVGWWCEDPSRQAPGDAGEVELRFSRDDRGVIDGRWRYGTGGQWVDDWDMTPVATPPPADLTARFDVAAWFCSHP